MAFSMYSSTFLHISINATEHLLFYYILDNIFHINFIPTSFLFLSVFQHSQKSQLLSSVFACSYANFPRPLKTVQYFRTMSLFSSCTAIHSQKASSAGERKDSTCMKVPLLLVSYHKPVSQFSLSEALLMPLIT